MFHINFETGEVNKCHAKIQCPFASQDEHYNTRVEAVEAYEKAMMESLFPTTEPDVKTLGSLAKRKLASFTTNQKIIDELIEDSDQNVLKKLAKNESMSPEQLVKIHDLLEDDKIKNYLALNSNYPKDKLTGEELLLNLRAGKVVSIKDMNTYGDEHALALESQRKINELKILIKNKNNQLSDKMIKGLVERHSTLLGASIERGSYSTDEMNNLSYEEIASIDSLTYRNNEDVKNKIVSWVANKPYSKDNERFIGTLLNAGINDKQAKALVKAGYHHKNFLLVENLDKESLLTLVKSLPDAKALFEAKHIAEKNNSSLYDFHYTLIKTTEKKQPRAFRGLVDTTYVLDKDLVKKNRLTPEHIKELFASDYNGEFSSYDEDSGIVRLTRDSTD